MQNKPLLCIWDRPSHDEYQHLQMQPLHRRGSKMTLQTLRNNYLSTLSSLIDVVTYATPWEPSSVYTYLAMAIVYFREWGNSLCFLPWLKTPRARCCAFSIINSRWVTTRMAGSDLVRLSFSPNGKFLAQDAISLYTINLSYLRKPVFTCCWIKWFWGWLKFDTVCTSLMEP